MRTNLTNRLLKDWGLVRFIRLALALIISYEAYRNYDWMLAVLGMILLVQAFLNTGCCGVNGCDIHQPSSVLKSSKETDEQVKFEEIK